MPWFSYHSGHSGQFCRHAKGDLAEVVQAAISQGFTHYGLSEHCPRDAERWLYPGEEDLGPAGLAAQFDAYVTEARSLQERFSDRIELLVGFETERLPESGWADRMRSIRRDHGLQYMVGSVHHVGEHWVDFSPEVSAQAAEALGGVEVLQLSYFRDLATLVSELEPEIVGHIDLIRKFDGPDAGFSATVMREIERTLEAVRAAGSLLDVNPGAHRKGLSPVYPLPEILERAREMGIAVTLGDDSHGPATVGGGLDECMRAIADAGYRELHYLTAIEGRVQARSAPLHEVRAR